LGDEIETTIYIAKPAWKTTEFWALLLVNFLMYANLLPLPQKYEYLRPVLTFASTIGYAVSRGLAKSNPAAPSLSPKVVTVPPDLAASPLGDPVPGTTSSASSEGVEIVPGR